MQAQLKSKVNRVVVLLHFDTNDIDIHAGGDAPIKPVRAFRQKNGDEILLNDGQKRMAWFNIINSDFGNFKAAEELLPHAQSPHQFR